MQNEIEWERAQELQAIGEHVTACMAEIMAEHDAETLYDLQRSAYRYTEAGISISFRLDDGTCVWPGDDFARDGGLADRVSEIGFSSVIEGSDAEIPLRWMRLVDIENAKMAASEYDRLSEETDRLACDVWESMHGDAA